MRTTAMVLVFVLPLLAQAQTREELTKTSKPAASPVKAAFTSIDDASLRAIKVTAGRSYSMLQFNMPKVQVWLPRAANSEYAAVDFGEPRLVDKKGGPVACEVEQGIFDSDKSKTEIRFGPKSGSGVIDFARAGGTIRIHYPTQIRTFVVMAAKPSDGVTIDGPYVTVTMTGRDIASASPLSHLSAVRGFDAKGQQLEPAGYSGSSDSRKFRFWGTVTRSEVDTVTEWKNVEAQYDLPSVAKLPASANGSEPETPSTIADTPGGKVDIRVLPPPPPPAAAPAEEAESAAPAGAKTPLTKEEAIRRLKKRHYPNVTADAFVMSAGRENPATVNLFLIAGLSVESESKYDHVTALHRAASAGKDDTALLLLRKGANPNAKDENDSTPLMWAAERCHSTELVAALVKAGANLNAKAKGGATPLGNARMMHCEENEVLLKKAGAK